MLNKELSVARYNHVAWTTPNDGEVLASLLGGVPPSIGGMAGGGGWGGRGGSWVIVVDHGDDML